MGLEFVHFNGMTGEFYYPEVIAPGVALFDFDNDSDLDAFLVQGQKFDSGTPMFPVRLSQPLTGRLFRNDLEIRPDGGHVVRFTDVTEVSGIKTTGYGMGVAVGDSNNDGCPDLYVTALGRNQLFRNDCHGRFADVSRQSGVDDDGWSVPATFLDYDRDGWLDLYVGHYLNWDVGDEHTMLRDVRQTRLLRAARVSGAAEQAVPQQPRWDIRRCHACRWNGDAVWSGAWRDDRRLRWRWLDRPLCRQ